VSFDQARVTQWDETCVWNGGVTLAVVGAAAPAEAKRFRGSRTVANASGQRAMRASRAKPIAQRTMRRVFAVRAGTEIYACSRHSFAESGCDFQFTSRFGNITCGNAVVRASSTSIIVRYDAFNTGCGDF
jgi:hypothetical protein